MRIICTGIVALGLMAGSAPGAVIIFQTPSGASTGGQGVDAKATFTTSTNQVSVLLENLQADPRSVVQALSGVQFTISTGQSSGTLSSSSGTERTITGTGAYSDGGSASTGWSLSTVGSSLLLNLLGTPEAPQHTIIGPPNGSNQYANANNSITNGTHSPFLAQSATFTLNVSGVASVSSINNVIFQFNTGAGNTVTGNIVPEPASISLLFGGLLLPLLRRRRASQGR